MSVFSSIKKAKNSQIKDYWHTEFYSSKTIQLYSYVTLMCLCIVLMHTNYILSQLFSSANDIASGADEMVHQSSSVGPSVKV